MRLLIVGNSGSGKSSYAARRGASDGLARLELDSIVWAHAGAKREVRDLGGLLAR